MSLIATAHEKSTICHNALRIVADLTGVSPRVAILTDYREDGTIDSFAYMTDPDPAPEARIAIDQIAQSRAKKIISQTMLEARHYEIRRDTLASYFTADNLQNELVQAEKVLLENAGYSIQEGEYFAFPVPTDANPMGILFVMARNGTEAGKMEVQKNKIASSLQEMLL